MLPVEMKKPRKGSGGTHISLLPHTEMVLLQPLPESIDTVAVFSMCTQHVSEKRLGYHQGAR